MIILSLTVIIILVSSFNLRHHSKLRYHHCITFTIRWPRQKKNKQKTASSLYNLKVIARLLRIFSFFIRFAVKRIMLLEFRYLHMTCLVQCCLCFFCNLTMLMKILLTLVLGYFLFSL